MLEQFRHESLERSSQLNLNALVEQVSELPSTQDVLANFDDFHVIREFKFASPTKGEILSETNLEALGQRYQERGSKVVSVLTEPNHFLGSSSFITRVKKSFPDFCVLRKDFITTKEQVFETRTIGADAMLLIAAMLSPTELEQLHSIANELELTPLVEVHTLEELGLAHELNCKFVGVNHRNLKTLEIDRDRSRLLSKHFKNAIYIAESALQSERDFHEMQVLGFHGALVGTSEVESFKESL